MCVIIIITIFTLLIAIASASFHHQYSSIIIRIAIVMNGPRCRIDRPAVLTPVWMICMDLVSFGSHRHRSMMNGFPSALAELGSSQASSSWCSMPWHCNECLRCRAHRASVLTNVLVLVSILHALVFIVADFSMNFLAAALTLLDFWVMFQFWCSSALNSIECISRRAHRAWFFGNVLVLVFIGFEL